ncbi:MAG TPA: hypothetical protein VKA21_06745 [Candidatus Binatia bacterium]|nr:hypothetical protein [Candidatus Binatia bacterium]
MSRPSPLRAVAGLLVALSSAGALACTTDADCDNGDTCSVADQCSAGSCVLGGGGDADNDFICDDEFDPGIDLRVTKITAKTTNAANHDTIQGQGDFIDLGSPAGAFTGTDGLSFRAKDQLSQPGISVPDDGFDATVTFLPSECKPQPTGLACIVASGPLAKSTAKFRVNRFAPNQMRFAFKIRGLSLTKPFFAPVRVILTHGTTRHRAGAIDDCRLSSKGIKCHEF